MVPSLNKKDIQDRITSAMENSTGGSYLKTLRKKKNNGVSSAEIKMKQKLGRHMKSDIAPVDPLKRSMIESLGGKDVSKR